MIGRYKGITYNIKETIKFESEKYKKIIVNILDHTEKNKKEKIIANCEGTRHDHYYRQYILKTDKKGDQYIMIKGFKVYINKQKNETKQELLQATKLKIDIDKIENIERLKTDNAIMLTVKTTNIHKKYLIKCINNQYFVNQLIKGKVFYNRYEILEKNYLESIFEDVIEKKEIEKMENLTKCNIQKAKRLFVAGYTIILVPCKCNVKGQFASKISINNETIKQDIASGIYTVAESFDNYVNAFYYYNCNPECGKKIHFYFEE